MKQAILSLFVVAATLVGTAQDKPVPSVKLQDIAGNTVDTGALSNDGNPVVICFWATWCSPCKKELNNYADLYADWQDEMGVKVVAVTIDDQRSKSRVKPYVDGVAWEYDVLYDPNRDFARAMGVQTPPHTFIVDGDGNIVWSHVGYTDGDEAELEEKLREITGQ
jgi:peroxiredoxin